MLQIAEALKRDKYFVLTTNYDEHVLKEGFPEDRVFEAHGNINTLQ
jgi:NAD-dependent SIR2 family protein deacetylase